MHTPTGGKLTADRSVKIDGALSEDVFNGAFSPMACVKANAGYIGLQAEALQLSFTSSTGNSDISIDGVKMSDNITMSDPIASNLILEFTTGDVDMRVNSDDIIEISTPMMDYRGFLKDVEFKYREEAARYKVILSGAIINDW